MQVIINLPSATPHWVPEILAERLKQEFTDNYQLRSWEDLLLDFVKVESDDPDLVDSNFLSSNKLIEDLYHPSVKSINETLAKFRCKVIDVAALGNGFIYNVEPLNGKATSRKALQSPD